MEFFWQDSESFSGRISFRPVTPATPVLSIWALVTNYLRATNEHPLLLTFTPNPISHPSQGSGIKHHKSLFHHLLPAKNRLHNIVSATTSFPCCLIFSSLLSTFRLFPWLGGFLDFETTFTFLSPPHQATMATNETSAAATTDAATVPETTAAPTNTTLAAEVSSVVPDSATEKPVAETTPAPVRLVLITMPSPYCLADFLAVGNSCNSCF